MRMEADVAELLRQNQDLCELVKCMLRSVNLHDFRPDEVELDSYENEEET